MCMMSNRTAFPEGVNDGGSSNRMLVSSPESDFVTPAYDTERNSSSKPGVKEFVKKSRHKEDKRSAYGGKGGRGLKEFLALPICHCLFCPKVFSHSKYLMKHIMRRHPDELLEMKSEANSETKLVKKPGETIIAEVLVTEIKELKDVFSTMKSEIVASLEPLKLYEQVKQPCPVPAIPHRSEFHRNIRRQKTQVNTKDKTFDEVRTIVQAECEEVKKQLGIMQEKTVANQNCVARITSESNSIKSTLNLCIQDLYTLKQTAEKGLQVLSFTVKEMQQQNVETQEKIARLDGKVESEIEKLRTVVEQVIEQVQEVPNIEDVLEKHLQGYLKKVSKKPSWKRSVPLRDKTFVVQQVNSDWTSRKLQNSQSDVTYNHLYDVLQSNIKDLGIATNIAKLSDSEYDVKSRLMHAKTHETSKHYSNFWTLREDIKAFVNEKAEALLKKENYRVVKFVDQCLVNANRSTTEAGSTSGGAHHVQESFSFVTAEDCIEGNSGRGVPTITISAAVDDNILTSNSGSQSSEALHSSNKPVKLHSRKENKLQFNESSSFNEADFGESHASGRNSHADKYVTKSQFSGVPYCRPCSSAQAGASLQPNPLKNADSASSLQSLSSWESNDDKSYATD